MLSMIRKKELQARYYWIILSLSLSFFPPRESIELTPARTRTCASTSGVSEFAVRPPSSNAEDISAPIPSFSPSSSRYLFLPVHWIPVPVCQLLYCTTVLFKVLYCQIKMFSSFFVLAFMCYLWEKYYKPTTVQCHVANCVSWVPRLTLLDLKIDWTYKHAPGMKIVHM